MKNKTILKLSFISLFAAIICFGCFMKIPLGPIPIVLQNILCILTSVLLGSYFGGIPTALFLFVGILGLPVYSGGTGGISVWIGPTGGFLPGYLIGAICAGFIAGKPSVQEKKISSKVLIRIIVAMIVGMMILYVPGVIHFSHWATKNNKIPVDKNALSYTMAACVIPYIPGDIIKIVITVPIALKLRPILAQYLYNAPEKKSENSEETKSDKNTKSE